LAARTLNVNAVFAVVARIPPNGAWIVSKVAVMDETKGNPAEMKPFGESGPDTLFPRPK
jgi:hypothetical protein